MNTTDNNAPTTENNELDDILSGTADFTASLDLAAASAPEVEETPEPVEPASKSKSKSGSKSKSKSKTDQAKAEAQVEPDLNVAHVPGIFEELVEGVDKRTRNATLKKIEKAFADRATFEASKKKGSNKMQDNLAAGCKKLMTDAAAGVLIATKVDPNFVNREISAGSRFNVYAIDKVNDLVRALETGHMKNAINNAVTRSLFKFRAEGVPFTGVMAAAAASDKIRVDKAVRALLVRHSVSAVTAPTQSSSTMSALQVMGIVENRGTQKAPVYVLTDTPQTRRLESVLGMAA